MATKKGRKVVDNKIPPQINVEKNMPPTKEVEETEQISVKTKPFFVHDDIFDDIWENPFSNVMN